MDEQQLRILLVDDDEDDYIITQELLNDIEGQKYNLDWVERYEAALEIIGRQQHDVYLIDYWLGERNGLELLREAVAAGCQAPLILLTGQGDRAIDREAMQAGAADYLVKDQMEAPLLERSIRHALERQQAQAEIRHRNRELALLNRVIAASVAELKPEVILETACRELALTFGLPQITAALLDEKKTAVRVVAQHRSTRPAMAGPPLENQAAAIEQVMPVDNNPFFQYLLNYKVPLVVDDVQNDPRLASVREVMRRRGLVSLLLLPLMIEGEVVGSLELGAIEPHHFSVEEINLIWSVADQLTGVLARARLTQTHQRLITAIEQSAESVVVTDVNGTILYVNPAFERITGYSPTETVGQSMNIIKSGQHNAAFYREMWQTISQGQVWRGRFINQKKDGALYTEEVTISPVRAEEGTIVNYVSVGRDVTRELHLEEQLRQSQKMDAIGQLAGGVAHDFNNMLTAVLSYTSLISEMLPANHPACSDIQGIQKSAERAANLTRQLLAFARKQIIEPKVLNLNDLVLNMDKMFRRLISEDIELVTLPATDLGLIKADPGQLEQVLVNLVINARDAMPHGGKLVIEMANVTFDQTYAGQHFGVTPGEYVMLAVSDTGIGMAEEVKAHIFEPFFTTKEVGKGTGLGLATVFGIVKQNDGHIWVYSEPGQGVTFKIYLPRVSEPAGLRSRQDKAGHLPYGTETLLLVEDEPTVRELAGRVLRQQGYKVIAAANGEEALRLAEEQAGLDQIDLLLTDVVMPRLGGKALADRLKISCPDLKVLFMSGYTDNAIAHRGVLEPGTAFLQKPFAPDVLARKVREVLDETG